MKIKEIVNEVATQVGTIQAVTPNGEVTMKSPDGSEVKTTKDAFVPTTDPNTLAMKPGDGVDVGDKVTTSDTTTSEAQDDSTGADAILGKVAADEDWDLMYKLRSQSFNSKAPPAVRAAGEIISQMYDDVTVDHPELHPDDDFEAIYNRVLDRIISDYSSQEEPASTDIETTETHHDHDRDELGQGPIGGDRTDDYIKDVSSELEEGPDPQLDALTQMLAQVQEPWEKKQIEWRIQNQKNRNAPGIDMGGPTDGRQLKPVVAPREWIKQNPNLAQQLPNEAKPPEMQTPGMLDRIKNLAGLK